MKILFINNGAGVRQCLSGGSERLLQLCKSLYDRGQSVRIITAGGDARYFDGLGLRSAYSVNPNPLALFPDTKITRSLWYFISIFTTLFYVNSARRADIIYAASDYVCDVIPGVMLSLLCKKRFVVFIHHECRPPGERKGIFFINFLSYWSQRFSYAVIRRFAHSIFFYDTQEGYRLAGYFPGCDVAFGLNGIDPSFHQQGNRKNEDLALFAGGLRPSKGIEGLIDVWALVAAQKPKAILHIAGGGDDAYTAFIRQKIIGLGMGNNIVLLGPLDKARLAAEYAEASLYLSCSHEEGWGISAYQALASGLEVFAYDLPCFIRIAAFCHLYPQDVAKAMAEGIVAWFDKKLPRKAEAFPARQYYWSAVLETDYNHLMNIANEN